MSSPRSTHQHPLYRLLEWIDEFHWVLMASWRKWGKSFVLRVDGVLGCTVICSWHLIWKWSVGNVIWFSFVGAHLKTGGWTLWPPTSEVFEVVWFWDQCKADFSNITTDICVGLQSQHYIFHTLQLVFRKRKGRKKKALIQSRGEYMIHKLAGIFLGAVCSQNGK